MLEFLNTFTPKRTYWFIGLLLALAAALRLVHLAADPPLHFAGLGQALITDPYHITVYARNKALFGEWNLFDYDRWVAFKVSLVSGFAWLVYAVVGVSRASANLGSVILNLGTLALIAVSFVRVAGAAGSDQERARVYRLGAVVAVGLLAVSHPLIVYSRAPFLENGLLLLAALTLMMTVGFGRSVFGAALAGALIPLCALTGKLFGVALAVPVFVTLVLFEEKRVVRILAAIIGASITTALWYILVLGDSAGAYHTYLQEQSLGLYGAPPGLSSPQKFFEHLISYGGEFRLWHFQPFVPALIVLGLLSALSGESGGGWKNLVAYCRANPLVVFLALWALSALGGLMIFQYRPLRYSLFVLTPTLGLCGYFISEILRSSAQQRRESFSRAERWLLALCAVFGLWFVITQARFAALGPDTGVEFVPRFVWGSLPFAIGAVVIFGVVARMFRVPIGALARGSALTLVALSALSQAYWYQRMASGVTYELRRFSAELGEAVDPLAVFTAPHGPNVTLDNRRRNLIYSFGLQHKDETLFDRYPITHIASDAAHMRIGKRDYPSLADAYEIARFIHRDGTIVVFRRRMAGLSGGAAETELERSERFAADGFADSALVAATEFCELAPGNLIGLRCLLDKQMRNSRSTEALVTGRDIIREDPDGSWSHALVARAFFYIAKNTDDTNLRVEASAYLARAQELNPVAADFYSGYVRQ